MRATVARLTARVAELEARPVLKVERLAEALDAHGHAALARKVFAHLGHVTLPLPTQDRAEELAAAYCDALREIGGKEWSGWDRVSKDVRDLIVGSLSRALAKLGAPPPAVAPGPLVAVSDEDLAVAFYSEPDRPAMRECIDAADLAGIRAVRAKLGAAEVTEERLAAALTAEFPYVLVGKVNQCALAILARLRATRGPLPKGGQCATCSNNPSNTAGGTPCDECGLVGTMPWGG